MPQTQFAESLELSTPAPKASRARTILARRLADIVCLPRSRITPVERHMAGDLLVDILVESDVDLRLRIAKRIAPLVEVAPTLLRFLAHDDIAVAQIILSDSEAPGDALLVETAHSQTTAHRLAIARRKTLEQLVVSALIAPEEVSVALAVLRNSGAKFSQDALDSLVQMSRENPQICAPLLDRPEMRPAQGLTMFWWASTEDRARILRRFAIGRDVMQEAAGDIFSMMSAADWQDDLVRQAMQFIERRQRNRAALDKSPFDSLEAAIDFAMSGLDAKVTDEIAYLSGIKPITGAKILTDKGGEPLAVLCKATGLKRPFLAKLWVATGRTAGTPEKPDPGLQRVVACFDTLSSNKAQTVLRYWNWALSLGMGQAPQAHAR